MRFKYVYVILLFMLIFAETFAGMMDKIKKSFGGDKKSKKCKRKVVAITIPKYKYVDVPLAKEIATIKIGKVKKMKVGKYKKYDDHDDVEWDRR